MRQPQICLGFSYNWHTLDKIACHNRPRKEKNAFCGQISVEKVEFCSFNTIIFWQKSAKRPGITKQITKFRRFAAKKNSFAPQICGEN